MLIRSQRKRVIVNLNNTDTLLIREGDKDFHIVAFNNTSQMYIGVYSTEAKAIKVLDMLEKTYTELEEYRYPVFQMPADDEVEE